MMNGKLMVISRSVELDFETNQKIIYIYHKTNGFKAGGVAKYFEFLIQQFRENSFLRPRKHFNHPEMHHRNSFTNITMQQVKAEQLANSGSN